VAKWLTIDSVHHQVAIAGQVSDALTRKAIAGALVQIEIDTAPQAFTSQLALRKKQDGDRWETMVERLDRALTRADGHFHFMDLPNGQYRLNVSLPGLGSRYGKTQAEVVVARNPGGSLKMATTVIVLPPTTLRGQITEQTSGEPVFMAQVRVQGSGESTFSDKQGNYQLIGLEVGNRTVQVVLKGYQQVTVPVILNHAGMAQTLNVVLLRATP